METGVLGVLQVLHSKPVLEVTMRDGNDENIIALLLYGMSFRSDYEGWKHNICLPYPKPRNTMGFRSDYEGWKLDEAKSFYSTFD